MAGRVAAGLQSASRHSGPMQLLVFTRLAAICFSFTIIIAAEWSGAGEAWLDGGRFSFRAQSWLKSPSQEIELCR
jgi:hypothetical protein